MGTIVFIALWAAGYKEAATDYQVLPQLVSLDSIAAGLFLMWKSNCKSSTDTA